MSIRRTITLMGAALALMLGMALPATADDGIDPIIGGSTVTNAPWAASVYRSTGSFTCSGTIIAPTWVLTARHCVSSGISVRVGSVTRSSATPISVTSTSLSPNGDLALLRLSRAFTTTYSQLAGTNPPVGATNQICGWGRTSFNGPTSDQLKCADVRVTSNNCRDNSGGQAICTTRITGNAWSGDSGGPQRYNGLQVGVASTADGRSTQQYGSVPFNRAWIRSVAGV